MRYLSLILALLVVTARAETYAPRAHPVIAELALTDGRVLKDAKILSDTAYFVSVACGGKIISVEKKLLPSDLLAQWPIDEERGAKDKAAEQAVIEKREALAAKNRALAEQAKQEHIRDAIAAAEKSKVSNELRESARVAAYEALQKSRGGMEVRGVGSTFGSILVLVSNVSGGAVDFDWQALRFTTKTGQKDRRFSSVVFDKDDVQDYVVKPHTQRVFLLRQIPVLEVESVKWEDRPELIKVRQLYRLRSAFDQRDHRMDFKPLPAKGEPIPDDDVTNILMAASRRYIAASLISE